jgi:hypothetical protein
MEIITNNNKYLILKIKLLFNKNHFNLFHSLLMKKAFRIILFSSIMNAVKKLISKITCMHYNHSKKISSQLHNNSKNKIIIIFKSSLKNKNN